MGTSMLSTSDNPFNPFTDWDAWYTWDTAHGYNTCNYLARIALTSPDLSDTDYELAIDHAIEEILEYNVTGTYVKVYKE